VSKSVQPGPYRPEVCPETGSPPGHMKARGEDGRGPADSYLAPRTRHRMKNCNESGTLLHRLIPCLLLNREPRHWFEQVRYPGPFLAKPRRMTDADLIRVLQGQSWIATLPPGSRTVDRIEFDLDCDGDADALVARDRRYRLIRGLFGSEREPLVVQTPSRHGLRILYRLPETPLEELVTGLETGLVAHALRGSGLKLKRGGLEIFPQPSQCNRLPIGSSMAILCPDSLEPYGDAHAEGPLTPEVARAFLERLEEWHSNPFIGLLEHLRRLPRQGRRPVLPARSTRRSRRSGDSPAGGERRGHRLGPELLTLIIHGLPGPSTRYEAEFQVGMAMWLEPSHFEDYGLPRNPTREDVAEALVLWLRAHHNGFSQEWTASHDRRTLDVQRHWTERYLATGSCGEAPVDRMRRAAFGARIAEGEGPLDLPHPLDVQEIMEIAEDLFPRGPDRYRFEVWTCCLLRATKSTVRYARERRQPETRRTGPGFVTAELSAEWMEGWPWGSGEVDGRRAYLAYRDALISKGWLAPVRRHVRPLGGLEEQPGSATLYRVREPRMTTEADLLLPRVLVQARIGDTTVVGRPLSEVEAYHALSPQRMGVHLRRRYGRSTARLIERHLHRLQSTGLEQD
jgi:hypothetical protein